MYISYGVDYALRALLVLASEETRSFTAASIAEAEQVPFTTLRNVLSRLRQSGLVSSSSAGQDVGYRLTRPANTISVAEVFSALDGPLVVVRGLAPEKVAYEGHAIHLQEVWIAMRASLREVLEHTTIGDIATGVLTPDALVSGNTTTSQSVERKDLI